MGEFVVFCVLVVLLKENGKEYLMYECYECCQEQLKLLKEEMINQVKVFYDEFMYEEVLVKIVEIIILLNIKFKVEVIYQIIEDLWVFCLKNNGDWYFFGEYLMLGGNCVVNKFFIYYMEGCNE